MLATLILAAAQAAAPVPPPPPAASPGQQVVIREIVVHRDGDAKAAPPKGKEERREIMIIRSGDRAAAGKDSERREVRILREPGAPGTRIAMLSCDDGAKVDSEATEKDGKKTRVTICAKGSSNVSRTQQLRDAAKRIAADPDLSEETRTRITLAINEAIARLPVNE
ncbi:hypothetical protein GGQ97_001201 [Sphingomonas kaistensis]|uniref:Uncharacterized protein n=1 Tax=Sphingomonas kaistensis TaxID=298708 RepID=A0A7X6BG08_9SPHN|nr:hypothetical protein [Sphingomonas kaistensis]NJC05408.1 hypothetical protein [Sphingomonas kaistensis]